VERNFFGVKRVICDTERNLRILVHGSTDHGGQSIEPTLRSEPLAYYHRSGPAGDLFSVVTGENGARRIAVIGLGIGSMAAYAEPGQHLTFYEIDPAVARIAANPGLFSFLSRCRGTYEIVLGDGRLTLADAPDGHYDLIVLDAFSSDAIPTHLLTREALQLYLRKLARGGVLAFHVSNNYLDLEPVVGRLAAEAGLTCWSRADLNVSEEERSQGKRPSHYIVMARGTLDVHSLADKPQWKRVTRRPDAPVWTDQYSNLLSLFRWR
jgi:spermidine synthase